MLIQHHYFWKKQSQVWTKWLLSFAIDIKNASLSTCLATKLNLSLIKEARVCLLFLVEAFAFPNEILTFPNFLRAIESQTNLKGSIRVEARAKHYAILAYKEEDILMIQFIIEEKGNLITNQLESSCIWRINHDAHLWGIKIRLPFQVSENEWIYNLFNGENCFPSFNLKEVVQVSDNCIIIFYKFIPLFLVCLIAKTKGFIWINTLIKAKCSIWTLGPTIPPPHWVPPLWGEPFCKPYLHCGDHPETRKRYHQQAFWRRATKL